MTRSLTGMSKTFSSICRILALSLLALSAILCIYLKRHSSWELILSQSGFAQSEHEGLYEFNLRPLAHSPDLPSASFIDKWLLKIALRSSKSRCEVFDNGRPLMEDARIVISPEHLSPGKYHKKGRLIYFTAGAGGGPGENGHIYKIRIFRIILLRHLLPLFLLALMLFNPSILLLFQIWLKLLWVWLKQPNRHRIYFILYVLLFSYYFLCALRLLYDEFPNAYTWGEVFINYEGGFVRRGLLGQVLFLVDPLFPVQVFYTSIYSIFLCFLCVFSYKKLMSVFDPLVVGFLFICPGMFLFNIFKPEIFGRKYIFMQIIIWGMARVCINCFTKKNSLYKSALALAALFLVGLLIYEPIFFYFPLFAVLLGVAYAREKKLIPWLLMTGAVFLTAFFVLMLLGVGSEHTRNAICASWALRYPDFTCEIAPHAISYIGVKLAISQESINALRYPTSVICLLLALLMSVMPLYFLFRAHNLPKAIKELLSISIGLRIAFGLAVSAPVGIFLIAHDFGVFIHTTLMAYLCFLYAVFSIQPQSPAACLGQLKEAFSGNAFVLLLLSLVYMLCWSLPIGSWYIFKPGVIFKLLQ